MTGLTEAVTGISSGKGFLVLSLICQEYQLTVQTCGYSPGGIWG
jgi:hypothetical protein